jgi:hypothetical protein
MMSIVDQTMISFVFPAGAVPTPNIECPNCDNPALYVLPDGGLFANKSFCAACETCWMCGDGLSNHMKFCPTCFCTDCGSVKNFPDMSEFDPKDICHCEPWWEPEHMDGRSGKQMSDSDDGVSDSDRPDSIS